MWTEASLAVDLKEIGLREGALVCAHTSLRAIGPIEGGAETLVHAFQTVLGPTGTLMVPTFTIDQCDPLEWRAPPTSPEELDRKRAEIEVFQPSVTPATIRAVGIFPEVVRMQPNAVRSNHPLSSFAAIGPLAHTLTEKVPFHYPLGSESPLARLHQHDGWVLLIGVDQSANSCLHLAEVWANVPYIHRSVKVKTGPEEWTTMWGSAECSRGFVKVEPILRQARLIQRGRIGNAESTLIRARYLVSMAVTYLQGKAQGLLCDHPDCRWCLLARKFTEPPLPLDDL